MCLENLHLVFVISAILLYILKKKLEPGEQTEHRSNIRREGGWTQFWIIYAERSQ